MENCVGKVGRYDGTMGQLMKMEYSHGTWVHCVGPVENFYGKWGTVIAYCSIMMEDLGIA